MEAPFDSFLNQGPQLQTGGAPFERIRRYRAGAHQANLPQNGCQPAIPLGAIGPVDEHQRGVTGPYLVNSRVGPIELSLEHSQYS